MKKIKLLVIFFFAIIFVLIIYKVTYKNNNKVLVIGEDININININNYDITKFLYDNITYKELLRAIDSNESIIIKNKRVYLNELIANTDYIIINANEIEYLKRCKNKVNNYYEEMLIKNKKIIINKIKKISNAKIIIIDNNCNIDNINNSKVIDFT